MLKGQDRPWHYGKLLTREGDEGDDDATTDAGTDADGLSTRPGSEVDEDEPAPTVDYEEDEGSLDELDDWDTVPAFRASSPSKPNPPKKASSSAQLSFISDIRPRLEKIARERENNLPEDDLEAFFSAEKGLKTRRDYIEPSGYTSVEEETEDEDEEEQLSGVGDTTSDPLDEWGVGHVSHDPLDDWDTVPAPQVEDPEEGEEEEDSAGLIRMPFSI